MQIEKLSQQYIGGQWRPGAAGKTLIDANPYDGSTIAEFQIADSSDLDEAYVAAQKAQQAWCEVNAYEKRGVFERAAQIVESRRAEIADIIAAELGGTALKAGFETDLVVNALKEAATLPLRIAGSILPSPVPDTENFVYREPVGVVGIISPFNFPFFLSMKGVAPALATGNGVVLKPHEDTPITGGTLLADVFEEAGLPAGLLNVVTTEVAVIGDQFLEHPIPQVIVFTGSTPVGRHIYEVAARNLKQVVLELGGHNFFIVCDDADIDYAVDSAVFSRFTHQGQICMSAGTILVQSSVAERFRSEFIRKVSALPVGDPTDPNTVIGPLINARQVETLGGLVRDAVSRGLTADLPWRHEGNLVSPVVLTDARPDASGAYDEYFGPVIIVREFDDEDSAIAFANSSSRAALSGAVHTRDMARGMRIARRIRSGMVHVNDCTIADEPIVPFGGERESGIGRLNGEASIDALTSQKWISVNHGRRAYPYQ